MALIMPTDPLVIAKLLQSRQLQPVSLVDHDQARRVRDGPSSSLIHFDDLTPARDPAYQSRQAGAFALIPVGGIRCVSRPLRLSQNPRTRRRIIDASADCTLPLPSTSAASF